jgi:hypothetical protein
MLPIHHYIFVVTLVIPRTSKSKKNSNPNYIKIGERKGTNPYAITRKLAVTLVLLLPTRTNNPKLIY